MSHFRIAAPFTEIHHIAMLQEAGAHELYCGFVDSASEKRWPAAFNIINRRGKGYSFEDIAMLREALAEAHRYGMPVFVTLNGMYTEEHYPWLLRTIDKISALKGFAGLIASDVALLLTLSRMKYDKEIHISTGGASFNNYALDFYGSLGARRVILDRQLTAGEIADIAARRNKKMGVEIFIMHSFCLFVDGFCTFSHCQDRGDYEALGGDRWIVRRYYAASEKYAGCQAIRQMLADKRYTAHALPGKGTTGHALAYDETRNPFGCNLCSLYWLRTQKNITLKIVGRGEDRGETVKAVSRAIGILNGTISFKDYRREARKLFASIANTKCTGMHCYCPPPLIAKDDATWKKQS